MKKIIQKMESLQECLEETISNRTDHYDGCSEKWQESEKGTEYQERTDRLSEMLDDITDWIIEIS